MASGPMFRDRHPDMQVEQLLQAMSQEEDHARRVLIRECESPIERLMMAGLLYYGLGGCVRRQKKIGPYRVDFFLRSGDAELVIETDGYEYHHKTTGQIARDNKRDRYLQAKGYKVFRFSYRELVDDVDKCVQDVKDAILEMQLSLR